MSRFISGGTDQEPTERDEAWLQAQKAVEARHTAKLDAGRQGDGKSLYEILQANKVQAAKQEAFEESIRLRNQFRSLDDDEVEFLDSIAAESQQKEAQVRRDAETQLESFRELQKEADKAGTMSSDAIEPVAAEAWNTAGRKRKKQDAFAGLIKKRQLSNSKSAATVSNESQMKLSDLSQQDSINEESAAAASVAAASMTEPAASTRPILLTGKKRLLGLADYSSDED